MNSCTSYPGAPTGPTLTPVSNAPAPPPQPKLPVECDVNSAHPCSEGQACCVPCCKAGAHAVCAPLTESGSCPLPDLTVDEGMLRASVAHDVLVTNKKTCPEALECLGGTGKRDLLRFTTASRNVGTAPLYIGKPTELPELFHWSECEQHFRQDKVMDFRLVDSGGKVVARGHKAGFCLMDDMDFKQTGKVPTFNCADQGISTGWGDLYGNPLDCQWVDVTGVKRGDYTLEVEINPDHRFGESDFGNNVTTAPVHIGK